MTASSATAHPAFASKTQEKELAPPSSMGTGFRRSTAASAITTRCTCPSAIAVCRSYAGESITARCPRCPTAAKMPAPRRTRPATVHALAASSTFSSLAVSGGSGKTTGTAPSAHAAALSRGSYANGTTPAEAIWFRAVAFSCRATETTAAPTFHPATFTALSAAASTTTSRPGISAISRKRVTRRAAKGLRPKTGNARLGILQGDFKRPKRKCEHGRQKSAGLSLSYKH